MTVWVDNMLREARLGRWPAKWSHLFASSPSELLEFAAGLDLNAAWLQYAGTHREHFDVPKGKRDQAITLGARPIRYPGDVGTLITFRRKVCQCRSLEQCRWGVLAEERKQMPVQKQEPQ